MRGKMGTKTNPKVTPHTWAARSARTPMMRPPVARLFSAVTTFLAGRGNCWILARSSSTRASLGDQ